MERDATRSFESRKMTRRPFILRFEEPLAEPPVAAMKTQTKRAREQSDLASDTFSSLNQKTNTRVGRETADRESDSMVIPVSDKKTATAVKREAADRDPNAARTSALPRC